MSKDKIIGIDVGATKIHVGVVQNGKIIEEKKFPTSAQAPEQQVMQELMEGIAPFIGPDVLGIGIGVPGLIDPELGIVYDLVNIPSWKRVPLKTSLEERFKIPVAVTNDANTFALGEKIYGKAQKYKNMVGITLGTGLGAGIIINNDLYAGAYSCAGELGGISYLDETIEDYCSGKFFKNKFGMEGKELLSLAEKGDAKAL
ncbi:MAG TPA: ROK family protein, partial [Salinimicrobium sp.]|nr:ROK family protein [Salinimicrobium sp.]